MLGLLLTLTGSVLLAVMVALRQEKDLEELTSTIVPVLGKVHPRVEGILKETYLFRMGLIYIAVGTLLQIFGFDIPSAEIDILLRVGITILGFILLLFLGKKISLFFVYRKLRTFPPFKGYNGNMQVGAMWIDESHGSNEKQTVS